MRHFEPWKIAWRGACAAVIASLAASTARAGFDTWTTSGPAGGPVLSVAIDPSNASRAYAGTAGGFFVSTDAGDTWERTGEGLPPFGPTQIAIDPSNSARIYTLTPTGIYRSFDSGRSWTSSFPVPAPGECLYCNLGGRDTEEITHVEALETGDILATEYVADPFGSYSALFRSTDGGDSWVRLTSIPSDFLSDFLRLPGPWGIPGSGRIYSFAGSTSLSECAGWESTDEGRNWDLRGIAPDELCSGPFPPLDSFSAAGSQMLFVVTATACYRSTDAGATWADVAAGLPASGIAAVAAFSGDPTTILVGSDSGLFRSSDSGDTWQPSARGLPDADVRNLAGFGGAGAAVLAATRNGIAWSRDGGRAWLPATDGPDGSSIASLALTGVSSSLVYAGSLNGGGVDRLSDPAGIWDETNTGLASSEVLSLAADPAYSSTLYAGTQDGVFKTTDGGQSWSPASSGLAVSGPFGANSLPIVHAIALDAARPGTLYAAGSYLFKTTDGGANWIQIAPEIPYTVNSVAIDIADSSRVYAGDFRSTDAGATWVRGAGAPGELIQIAVDTLNSATVYAAYYDDTMGYRGVVASTDAGVTWTETKGSPSSLSRVNFVLPDTHVEGIIYSGTDAGLFRSTDRGATWESFGSGLPSVGVTALVEDASGQRFWAATAGAGVYEFRTVRTNGGVAPVPGTVAVGSISGRP